MNEPIFNRSERAVLIEHMLGEVEVSLDARGKENRFIESLREQFEGRGDLSDKQIGALRSFYENVF